MTGYESKRAAAQDKLDDDDTQVYQDHDDALTIAYQSGYYDGKKAAHLAQEPVAYLCKPDQHGLFDRPTPDKACEDCFPVYAAPPQPTQEPVAWKETDEVECPVCKDKGFPWPKCGHITYLESTPPQPAQEPVGVVALDTSRPFVSGSYNGQVMPWSQAPAVKTVVMFKDLPLNAPIYATPPQRTWVGLTDEEINTTWKKWIGTERANKSYTKAIEAKLKERNGG